MSKAYQQVTDKIVTMLEAGAAPWRKPWAPDMPAGIQPVMARPLRSNGEAYRGFNVLNLWAAGALRGFNSRHWMTYKTAASLGGQVKKGAKSELAFYMGTGTAPAEDGAGEDRTFRFLKSYCVFNADEIDGLPERFHAPAPAAPAPVIDNRMPAIDAFVSNTGAIVAHGGNRAFYTTAGDRIQMPHLAQFNEPGAYYSTLLHEMVHWTSQPARCDRRLGARFGDDVYAAEELIAELGAAFLCADLGVSNEPREDHASYLASWLRVLKADNRAIFKAATLAEKAADFLHAAQQPAAIAA